MELLRVQAGSHGWTEWTFHHHYCFIMCSTRSSLAPLHPFFFFSSVIQTNVTVLSASRLPCTEGPTGCRRASSPPESPPSGTDARGGRAVGIGMPAAGVLLSFFSFLFFFFFVFFSFSSFFLLLFCLFNSRASLGVTDQSSGAVWKSRRPSWAPRPQETSWFLWT